MLSYCLFLFLLFFPTFHRASLAGNVEIIELLLSKVSGKKSFPKYVLSGRGNIMSHLSEHLGVLESSWLNKRYRKTFRYLREGRDIF